MFVELRLTLTWRLVLSLLCLILISLLVRMFGVTFRWGLSVLLLGMTLWRCCGFMVSGAGLMMVVGSGVMWLGCLM